MHIRSFMTLVAIGMAVLSCRDKHSPNEVLQQDVYVYREMSEESVPGARIQLFRESRKTKPFAEAVSDDGGRAVITARYGDARPSANVNWYVVAAAEGYTTSVANGSAVFRRGAILLPMRRIKQE